MTDSNLPLEISCQDVATLRQRGEPFMFIDCREEDEAAICAIEGARLFPTTTIQDRVGELAGRKQDRLIVHCHKGGRSFRVAAWLRQQGFANAQSMAGGIDQWAAEIEPGMLRY
jgi:rhodanese-related sulfurtransferase